MTESLDRTRTDKPRTVKGTWTRSEEEQVLEKVFTLSGKGGTAH